MTVSRINQKIRSQYAVLAAMILALAVPVQQAEAWFNDMDFSFGGFFRVEGTFRTADIENPYNQGGNYYSDVSLERVGFAPPHLALQSLGGQLINWGDVTLGNLPIVGPVIGAKDTIRRGDIVPDVSNDTNYLILRGEAELGITLTPQWRFVSRVRAIYDPTVYDEFDARRLSGIQGGLQSGPGADPALYSGRPNYFDYTVPNGRGGFSKANPLEWTGRDYQIYFPAMLLEYSAGDLSFRLGNQQIAWGQSIFFRVFDLPNGLDLRRHLILDRALEEFSDKRVPMLSARLGWQATDNILLDAYVGKFQPTVFGNPNTPYNIIPVQFTVQDMYREGGYDNDLVYGLRLKGDYGQWGWQAAASRRYGPEGAFRWTETGINQDLFGTLGTLVNTLYSLKLPNCGAVYDPGVCRLYDNAGEALSHTPFQVGPAGIYTPEEWFRYAADARLDGIVGLNYAITELAGSEDIYASTVDNFSQAYAQLDTFFLAAGGSLRGHIAREYHQENVFALGASYVVESDNDFLNQLIFNLEVQYTPERTFTAKSLSRDFIRQDEYTISFVVDKWHRFFEEFPGTYIVFQALTKNRSDLVGRHLSGYGGLTAEQMQARAEAGIVDTYSAKGKHDNATYFVLGFTQPFPNKILEIEFATLFDPDGGVFVQPGVRWNPGKSVTVEGFYNYINGNLWGSPYDNLLSTLEFAEEFTLRLTYQF
jgi:hypothetical protein